MRKKIKEAVFLAVMYVGVVSAAHGAGFAMYEGSARANALGTEVTADPVSPSVIFNNPAAITALPGFQFEAGLTAIRPRQTVDTILPMGAGRTRATSKWWVPPHAYMSWQVAERVWFGFGVFCRYGLGVDYPDDWPGRYNWTDAEITSFDVNPNIAVKLTDQISLSVGIRAETFDARFTRQVSLAPFTGRDYLLDMEGDDVALGYNVGFYWTPQSNISFGASYQSRVEQHIRGTGTCAGGDYDVASDLTAPAMLYLGTSLKPMKRLKINFGVVYTMWNSFDTLAIRFDPALFGSIGKSASHKGWKTAIRPQVGAELALTTNLFLRGGYVYDQTPDPDAYADYLVPGNNRHLFSLGCGINYGRWFFDAAYTYLFMQDRVVIGRADEGVFDGEFTGGDAHMMSFSAGFCF